jgi:hypothetical protein
MGMDLQAKLWKAQDVFQVHYNKCTANENIRQSGHCDAEHYCREALVLAQRVSMWAKVRRAK